MTKEKGGKGRDNEKEKEKEGKREVVREKRSDLQRTRSLAVRAEPP